MDVKSLHFQSVACPRMRTLVLQTMDFQSIVVDCQIPQDHRLVGRGERSEPHLTWALPNRKATENYEGRYE